jgi:hypothetical protein
VFVKFPISRFLTLLAITCIGISACISAPAVIPTPTETATSTLTPTNTSIPPTATETPDPTMPLDATGKDSDGNWIKKGSENGKEVTETFYAIQLVGDAEKGIKGHWFFTDMKNGDIDLIESKVNMYGGTDVNVMYRASVLSGYGDPAKWGLMQHTSLENPQKQNIYWSFTSSLIDKFFWRSMWGKSTDMNLELSQNPDFQTFYKVFTMGELTLTIQTPTDTFTYIPTKNLYHVLVVKPEDLKGDSNAFHTNGHSFKYVKSGNTIYVVSSMTTENPGLMEKNRLFFSPYFFMIVIGDPLAKVSTLNVVSAGSKLYEINSMADSIGPGSTSDGPVIPFIDYVP